MNSVHADCIHRMKILKLLTIFSCEGDVPSDLSNRTSGFHSTHHVPLREILVFEAH
jgi:hypothetical protein